ncbi:MAG: hypothetical protein MJ151_02835, partial [Lachnospiraceae bacterium]|nr:hypothetical protein [Lachnospiraceae bacterium]
KVNIKYPEYKVNKIIKFDNKYLISIRTIDNSMEKGTMFEYKNNKLISRGVSMEDMLSVDEGEIIYDAYPGEF